MGGDRSPDTTETAMQGTAFAIADTTPDLGLVNWLRRRRDERRARRTLERELADYATLGDRDDLAALMAGWGAADSDAAAILVHQARRDLFRSH
jgi:hypothetical protein